MSTPHHVVIVGGGFAGLKAAASLKKAPVQVTLLDRRNYHLFQPLLYQVATGGLSPANIASPLREILKRRRNVQVLLAEVVGFRPSEKKLVLCDGEITYDSLVVAAGATNFYFGHDDWEEKAPGLKSLEDATEIRRRIFLAFERAEREKDPARLAASLTFVVIGGGATGVEMAGALAEIACDTLRHNFRTIDPAMSKIILLEGAGRVLPPFAESLSAKAHRALEKLGVVVRTGCIVQNVQPDRVTLLQKGHIEELPTYTVIWAAGVKASPLGQALSESTGAQLDRQGRVIVEPDLSLPGHPEIHVLGDLANFSHQGGKPLPGVAPVAMQQGAYVGGRICDRLAGKATPAFFYKDRGSMATIGRARAVVDLGWVRFNGFLAWWTWLFIHLMNIVAFHNRLLVLLQWAWNYFTMNRSARLITGKSTFSSAYYLPPGPEAANEGKELQDARNSQSCT